MKFIEQVIVNRNNNLINHKKKNPKKSSNKSRTETEPRDWIWPKMRGETNKKKNRTWGLNVCAPDPDQAFSNQHLSLGAPILLVLQPQKG